MKIQLPDFTKMQSDKEFVKTETYRAMNAIGRVTIKEFRILRKAWREYVLWKGKQ